METPAELRLMWLQGGFSVAEARFRAFVVFVWGVVVKWATWPEGASAPNSTVKCRGHGVPEMVTPASRRQVGRQQFCSFV